MELSKCCNAPVRLVVDYEPDKDCTKCGKPCEVEPAYQLPDVGNMMAETQQTMAQVGNPYKHRRTIPNGKCPELSASNCAECKETHGYCIGGDCDMDCKACVWQQGLEAGKASGTPTIEKIAEIIEQHMPAYFGDLDDIQARDSVMELAAAIQALFNLEVPSG